MFSDIQMSWRNQMPKHEKQKEIWSVYVIIQNKNFCDLESGSRLFLIFKELSVKNNLKRLVRWFG